MAQKSTYSRVKKYRYLLAEKKSDNAKLIDEKSEIQFNETRIDNAIEIENDVDNDCSDILTNCEVDCDSLKNGTDNNNVLDNGNCDFTANGSSAGHFALSNGFDSDNRSPINVPLTLKEKVKDWAIEYIGNMDLVAVTGMLEILRSEGHKDIPATASTLLGFSRSIKSKPMLSAKNKGIGQYAYLGIENGLSTQLRCGIYRENKICVLAHIDGMKIYNDTKGQLWPIIVKMFHKDYNFTPFVVALFYGRSKPGNVDDFLRDFVKECSQLTHSGISLNGTDYSFCLTGIIGDGPARAFIKCIKGPTGFSACERCTVPGITENKKRVYPEIDCPQRTKASFIAQIDKQHHPGGIVSPVLEIPGLDPVRDFPQEIMHLLFLNLVKNLLSKLLDRSSKYKISTKKMRLFRRLMSQVTACVPGEFGRNEFDADDSSHWKATQCSFFLLYIGGIIMQFILEKDEYYHFLHLHVACRMLCSRETCVVYCDQADRYLRTFVKLMPTFYGSDSQVLHVHSLIHISEDVKHFNCPLSELSAYWGENFIGKFKNLVTGRARPLSQIVNRVTAQQNSKKITITKKQGIQECLFEKYDRFYNYNGSQFIQIYSIKYNDITLMNTAPDNLAQTKNGQVISIKRILVRDNHSSKLQNPEEVLLQGYFSVKQKSAFTVPCSSEKVGIFEIEKFDSSLSTVNAMNIKCKCVPMKIDESFYAISSLH